MSWTGGAANYLGSDRAAHASSSSSTYPRVRRGCSPNELPHRYTAGAPGGPDGVIVGDEAHQGDRRVEHLRRHARDPVEPFFRRRVEEPQRLECLESFGLVRGNGGRLDQWASRLTNYVAVTRAWAAARRAIGTR